MDVEGSERSVKENGELKASPKKGGNGSKDTMEGMASFSVPFRWSFSRYCILLFHSHPYCPAAGGSSADCLPALPVCPAGGVGIRGPEMVPSSSEGRALYPPGLRYTINMPCGFRFASPL